MVLLRLFRFFRSKEAG